MLMIKLARHGARNNPFYKIVVTEKKSKRDGKFIDQIGYWEPVSKVTKLSTDKVKEWLGKGAQMTNAVKKLFDSYK